MYEAEIQRLKLTIRHHPDDVEAWALLLRHVARSGCGEELLADLGPSEWVLDQLWERVHEDRGLLASLLPRFGLELVTGKPESPGRYWYEGPRLADGGDHWFDRLSGLPLEVRRLSDGAPMVLVPAGRFLSLQRVSLDREEPDRLVNLGGFYVDRYPVTVERYSVFLESTGHRYPSSFDAQLRTPHRPVVQVAWDDAAAYAAWAGARLLGDAAWEKAARGPDGAGFPWGGPDAEVGAGEVTRRFLAEGGAAGAEGLREVGRRPEQASPYGVHDMAGLVREWCGPEVLHGRDLLTGRRIRGSSRQSGWLSVPLRADAGDPKASYPDVGFRLGRPLTARVARPGETRLARAA